MPESENQVSLSEMGDMDGRVDVMVCGLCESSVFSILANGSVFCARCKAMAFGLSVLTNKVKQ